ncbi:MAG: carboxypeptidase-like regulatory domain-containing protein [Candidatus Acidiferrum sp.]
MRRATGISLAIVGGLACFAGAASAQNSMGALEITARVTPTAARPEPVREFTFYVLTKSYGDIAKEVAAADVIPPRDEFIDGLDVSKELKVWLKGHNTLDLTSPDLDKLVTPDDIIHTPEFLVAYQHSNSGGVTNGIPKPKYRDADKKEHPEKYQKELQEYYTALKKFIERNPATVSGLELELYGINPQRKWALLQGDQKKRVQRLAPEVAQTRYLAAKVDTDLDGNAIIRQLPPGKYWISSLNLEADAGDARARWDVPITIEAGQTLRLELTNLNSTDTLTALAP